MLLKFYVYIYSMSQEPRTQESLEHDSVIIHEESVPIEQDILCYKQIAELINSKIKLIKASDVPVKQKVYENANSGKDKLLTEIITSQHKDNALHNIFISETLEEIKGNSLEEPSSEIYKQKVIEQLDLLKNNYEHLMELYNRKEKTVQETFKNSMLIIDKQQMFKNKLQERKEEYQKECEESVRETYKQGMKIVNSRIQKINFMRIIISRLLIYYIKNYKDMPEFKEMLQCTKSSVSIDSLLKE